MTKQTAAKPQTVPAAVPQLENRPLDERVWQAWVEKNEKRDKVSFGRRLKVTAIVLVLLALAALIRTLIS